MIFEIIPNLIITSSRSTLSKLVYKMSNTDSFHFHEKSFTKKEMWGCKYVSLKYATDVVKNILSGLIVA